MMDRRAFIGTLAGGLLAAPLTAGAQQTQKVWRIGYLDIASRSEREPTFRPFAQRLRELGYVEGRNLVIEWRQPQGRKDVWSDVATEMVQLKPDVIVVPSTQPAMAVKGLTGTIPIVTCAASDVAETGLVSSLARPGGNITGLAVSGGELSRKRLELLREVLPKVSLVAVLADPTNATHAIFWRETQIAAQTLRIRVERVDVQVPDDIGGAFAAIRKQQAGALIVFPEPMLGNERTRIAELAAKSRLPTMFGLRSHVDAGGLMSYAPSYPDLYRHCADYVDKILKGTKPADLPIEEPTKFELVINMKTAKALGLTIPPSVLLRADQVIE